MDGGASRPLRVLWLIKGLGFGGAERLLVSLAQARDPDRVDCRVMYLLPWKAAFVPQLEASGVPVECLRAAREWNLGWAWRLRRRLLADRPDVVHLHSPYVAGVTRLLVRTLPKRLRPILVTTEHIPVRGLKPPTRLLNFLTFSLDAAHFAVSDAVRDSLPSWRQRQVETLVHGVVLEQVRGERASRESVRAELGIAPEEIVVGTIANYLAQKAYPVLLTAQRQVADAALPVRFVVVGQGPLEQQVKALHAELGLEGTVLLLGRRPDAVRVLSACDMFALASHYEGYPVAVMEALAIGLPIVATRVGGIPDAVEHGREGLLVQPGRADLLAEAVLTLARDPERRAAMAAAAYAKGARFDIAHAMARIEQVYRELTGRADEAGGDRDASRGMSAATRPARRKIRRLNDKAVLGRPVRSGSRTYSRRRGS